VASSDLPGSGLRGLSLFHDVVDSALSRRIREQLLTEERHRRSEIVIESQRHLTPRLTSSFSDVPLSLVGMDTSQPWTPELAELREAIGQRFGLTFNYALANLYRHRFDFTGWHCDKAWLHEPGSTIAIASFGATRSLAIRPLGGSSATRIPLKDSSVVLMDLDLQATHEHSVLAESEDVDMRLSITLRRIQILPEYLDGGRQRRRCDGVTSTERNQASALHR
jgi:alkylated DNA repair dioxygenase AlkB